MAKIPCPYSVEQLRDMYCNQEMSAEDIARKANFSPPLIRKWMRESGIPLRTMQEAQRVRYSKEGAGEWRTERKQCAYCNQQMTPRDDESKLNWDVRETCSRECGDRLKSERKNVPPKAEAYVVVMCIVCQSKPQIKGRSFCSDECADRFRRLEDARSYLRFPTLQQTQCPKCARLVPPGEKFCNRHGG